METSIVYRGKIEFDQQNFTKKHVSQSSWKRTAMVMFTGEICEYYSYLLKKRYRIILNKPLRGAHVSFINDSMKDLSQNGTLSNEQVNELWNTVKTKWHGKEIEVVLNVDARTDGDSYWWLNVPEINRAGLQAIRAELGLGRPYFSMHMTIGSVHPHYIEHSKYILSLIENGLSY